MSAGANISFDRIVDEEQIAHLPPVAEDRDRFARQNTQEKMGDPALILGAHLAGTIDAAHPHHRGRQAERARIVEHILLGCTFRTAVGRVKLERAFFRNAAAAQDFVARLICLFIGRELDIGEIAIDLIGAGKDEGGARTAFANGFEQPDRGFEIDRAIFERIEEAARHRDLRGEMKNGACFFHGIAESRGIAHVGDGERDLRAVARPEPSDIAFDAGANQSVVDEDMFALARQTVGEIGADKARAAGHENRADFTNRRCHATSPRISNSRRA